MANGRIDTQFVDLGTLDPAYVAGFQTRSGLNFADLINGLNAEMSVLNSGLDPLVASLIYPTTATEAGALPEARGFSPRVRGEYVAPRPQRAERSLNHMLPLRHYEQSLGYTEDKLRSIKRAEFDAQNRAFRAGWEAFQRREVLEQLFRLEEIPVDTGTSAMSPGFAGSGIGGSNELKGQYPDGAQIAGGYTHYLRDEDADIAIVTLNALKLLRRWYPAANFDLLASPNTVDKIAAISTGAYVPAGSSLIRPGQGTAEALVDAARYVGVLHGGIRVLQPVLDIPDGYIAVFRSGGALSIDNPLAWRYDELIGRDVVIKSRSMYPLHDAIGEQSFGIGTNNRVSTVLIKLAASGAYTSPTFS